MSGESGDLTAKEKLLIWSQQATEGYPGLRCANFTSSWSDGRMFNALLHRYRLEEEHCHSICSNYWIISSDGGDINLFEMRKMLDAHTLS